MTSWLGGGKGGGPGTSKLVPPKPKKKERWLVTRKTWRYMADAGKLLIPESLRKGKDYKDYTEDDLRLLEEHFHDVCEQQREFVIWEGPGVDPRVLLAKNRKAPSQSSDQADSLDQSEESSDYRFESHTAKFRIVLPTGEKPPPGYNQVGTRSFALGDHPEYKISDPRSYIRLPSGLIVQELPAELLQDADWSFSDSSPLDSGILSPSGDFLLSPRDHSPCSEDEDKRDIPARESGIGSGLDAIAFSNKRNMIIQTDPLPNEFYELQAQEEEHPGAERRQEEGEKVGQESPTLSKREYRRASEDYDPATMGETFMRYLKMVRRNSKSVDQKKVERFRSMNYDPTLRNIKSKYVHIPSPGEVPCKHTATQCDDSLIRNNYSKNSHLKRNDKENVIVFHFLFCLLYCLSHTATEDVSVSMFTM